jgi:cell division protein FtsI (penicillin-binding protein 3)
LQRTQHIPVSATRGEILDSTGQVLAQDVDAREVVADPTLVSDINAAAAQLSPLLNLPASTIAPKLERKIVENKPSHYSLLAQDLTPAQGGLVTQQKIPGISVVPETKRIYPNGDLASDVLGFTQTVVKKSASGVNTSIVAGVAGIEGELNSELQGTAGSQTVEVDPSGTVIPGGSDKTVQADPGKNVTLTINGDIQWEAQQAIAAQVAATKARSGTVVVLDPTTGQVLADVTAPSFNSSDPGAVSPDLTGNRTVSDYYEPGSVNKMIVAAAALQTGALNSTSVLDIPPTLKVADATFHDAEAHGDEKLTLTGILAKSSNIGAIEVAQRLGNATVDKFLKLFGLGAKTGIELPGETAGVLPDVNTWQPTTAATIPFGQGMDVNSIQVAAAYAALANNGKYIAPRIVKSVTDTAGKTIAQPQPTTRQVISPANAATLRLMMEQVTSTNGTAPGAAIAGYLVAGKTGTANAIGANGRYDGGYTATFVGMAPADAPKLVVEVVLDHPQTDYYGGTAAAPVFKDVMSFALKTLGIAPTNTTAPMLPING